MLLATSDFNVGLAMSILGVVFAVYLFFAAGWVGVLRKAGLPVWPAFVPWTHFYWLAKLVGRDPLTMWMFGAWQWIPAMHDLAGHFGKRWRFGLGLIFLPPVFLLILGLGRAEYAGPVTARMPEGVGA